MRQQFFITEYCLWTEIKYFCCKLTTFILIFTTFLLKNAFMFLKNANECNLHEYVILFLFLETIVLRS